MCSDGHLVMDPHKVIRVLSLNTRSLRKHFNDLSVLLNSFQFHHHFIILSETWIYTDETDRYHIPGYISIAQCRDHKRSGGVIIYIEENIRYNNLNLTLQTGNIIGLNVTLENYRMITLIGIYRFCDSSPSNFIDEISSILISANNTAVIAGDININLLDDYASNDYLNLMYSHGFISVVDQPTFFGRSDSLPSCIDHIFVRGLDNSAVYNTVQLNFSDHLGLNLTLALNSKLQAQAKRKTYFFDKKLFFRRLSEIDISNLYISRASLDEKFCWFMSQIVNSLQCSKKCSSNVKRCNRKRSPWITSDIIRLSRGKDLIYKLIILFPKNVELKSKFKALSRAIQKAVKVAKKDYFSNLLDRCSNNQKQYWAVINQSLGKRNPGIQEVAIDDCRVNVLGNERLVAKCFNEYFRDSVAKLVDELPLNSCVNDDPLSSNMSNSFVFLEFTPDHVKDAILSLANKSSFGLDGISITLIKENIQFFINPLTYLFNESIKCGKFPDVLKTGIITPVFKSGIKTEISNYRPICILPTISKIFEKCVIKLLSAYLEKVKFFSTNQFGFLQGRGTDDALFEHVRFLTETLEAGRSAVAVYFDIRKAFDTVNHSILLQKLYACGIRDFMFNWFKSYLSSRQYMTKINGISSESITSKYGVPQGSILGPYLFLIYINDLCNLKINGRLYSYADDTVLVTDSRYTYILHSLVQDDVNKIARWLNVNRLVINTEKTKYMIFSFQPQYVDEVLSVSINNRVLERVYEIKYLGTILDSKLTWYKHTLYLAGKLRKLNYVFYYLSQIFTTKHLHRLYLSLYQPVLIYSIIHWGGAANSHIAPLQVLQTSLLKHLFRDSSVQVVKPIPTVKQLYEVQLLNFVFKNRSKFSVSSHNGITRSALVESAMIPKYNKYHARIQCAYKGAILFNSLPPLLKIDLKNYKRRHKRLTHFITNRDLKL